MSRRKAVFLFRRGFRMCYNGNIKGDDNMNLMKLLETRRTYRRFDQSRPVSAAAFNDMALALRWSSSAGNLQPLRCVFVTDPQIVEAVFPHTHFAALLPKELGTPKPGEHPTMYVVLTYEKKTKWTDTDAGIALSNLTLAAWGHGVGSCIMDKIDRPDIAEILHIPESVTIHSAVALGYPTHTSQIVDPKTPGDLKYFLDAQKNYKVPKRPFSEFIFENRYPEV